MEKRQIVLPGAEYIESYRRGFENRDQREPYKLTYNNRNDSGSRRFTDLQEAMDVMNSMTGIRLLQDCANKKIIAYIWRDYKQSLGRAL